MAQMLVNGIRKILSKACASRGFDKYLVGVSVPEH